MPRQPVAPPVQLSITERTALIGERHRVRPFRGTTFEKLMKAKSRRILIRCPSAPPLHDFLSHLGGDEWDGGDGLIWLVGNGGERDFEIAGESGGGIGIK